MTRTIQQAAAETVALINSKPTSPSESEITAIISRVGIGALAAMSPEHAALYREWRSLIEEHMRAFPTSAVPPPYTLEIKAEEERMGAHMQIIEALAERILETPVRTWGDVLPYAEVCFWRHWAGVDPQSSEAEVQMRGSPFNGGKLCDEALARVLKAIFALGRPGSATAETEAAGP